MAPVSERDRLLRRVAERLSPEHRVTVLTGAGVSAASGIPTFRGADGLWRTHRVEQLATPEAFARDPGLVWEWYDWRRQLIAAAAPNRAHEVLAAWSRRLPRFTLITQNVDGLHERAGTDGVLRLHGSIWDLKCTGSCRAQAWQDLTVPLALAAALPVCPTCGALARPGVVWFGEALDPKTTSKADAATACDLFLTVGTSAVVYPAAGLVHEARRHGALTVEINPDDTPATEFVDVVLRRPAADALDALDALMT